MPGRLVLTLVAVALLGAMAAAQERKPPLPPGRDPGGVAVALVSTGIDYTLPQIAGRLARDGEGELIGLDLENGDNRPFDRSGGRTAANQGGDGTALAHAIAASDAAPAIRLVPVRIDPAQPASLASAVAFIALTPARIAAVPMWSERAADWEPFRQAAQQARETLIIVPAGEGVTPAYPAALGLETLLVVTAAGEGADGVGFAGAPHRLSGLQLAVAAAARAAASILARQPQLGAAELKRRLLASGGGGTWRPQR